MNRKQFLRRVLAFTAAPLALSACKSGEEQAMPADTADGGTMNASTQTAPVEPLDKPLDEWRELLPEDQYAILFEEATEPPFSSPLNDITEAGTFICAACNLPLFDAATKFKSGTGWPSFYRSIAGHTATKKDYKLVMPRTEYHCARCGGHQGHIFNDGPQPTGQRWCNNGLALKFVADGTPLPELIS